MDIMSPRHLKIANWSVLAVLILAGYLWLGREFALGVLVGGLVVVINFHLLASGLERYCWSRWQLIRRKVRAGPRHFSPPGNCCAFLCCWPLFFC